MNPLLLSSFHDELAKIASVGVSAASIGGSLIGGEAGDRLANSLGIRGTLPRIGTSLAASLAGSMLARSLYRKIQERKRRKEMKKLSFVQRPLFTMSRPELLQERSRLTRDFYTSDRKTPAVAGIAGGALSAAMSKAVVGKGMIPAAVVGGMLSAQAASSVRKKRTLNRLRAVSNRLRSISAPVSAAKRK